jgi:4-hydroxy-4-methyl-2-oxoglutarate aldolase
MRHFTRADIEKVETLSGLPVGWVSDALDSKAALPAAIKPITRNTIFTGSALTVATKSDDNLALYAALSIAKAGDVLVIAADPTDVSSTPCSLCGDILAGFAKNAGISAIVTNGMVRDRIGLDTVGLPVFAAGLTPNAPFKEGPGSCGLPVKIGKKIISSGDIICGDHDGIVHIAQSDINTTLAGLKAVAEKETTMDAKLLAGHFHPDWLEARLKQDDIEFLEA